MLSFTTDFSNVKPLGTYTAMPEMPFKARIVGIETAAHKSEAGATVATIQLAVTEPGYEAAQRRFVTRVPDATEKGQNSRRGWRTLLESVGYQPAQLEKTLTVTETNFVNKEGFFYHRPRTEGMDGSYDDVEAITPQTYADRKRAMAARAVGGGVANVRVEAPGAAPLDAHGHNNAPQPPAAGADLRNTLLA